MNFIQAFEDWVASSKTQDFVYKISGADFKDEAYVFDDFTHHFDKIKDGYGWFDYDGVHYEFDHTYFDNILTIKLGD